MQFENADTTPSKCIPESAAGSGGRLSEQGKGSLHPNLDDLPQDLLEILNLAPKNPTPKPSPKHPASAGPPETREGELSLASSPSMLDSPAKPYSPFPTRTQIVGSRSKQGSPEKFPSPPKTRAEIAPSGGGGEGGDMAPPNSPDDALSPFSLFSDRSLNSVSSAKIPAKYLREATKLAKEDEVSAEKLEEAVATPEFSFPKLDPAAYPALSWA